MKLLIVDWLGRGGIAECTAALAIEANRAGAEVVVVTRPDRDLSTLRAARVVESRSSFHALGSHLALVSTATTTIADESPDIVVAQNHILPLVDRRVLAAARRAGSYSVLVIHDHRHHSALAGSSTGARRLMRAADEVVAHSRFVAHAITPLLTSPATVVPLPMPLALLEQPPVPPPFPAPAPGSRLALHFGVLKRRYKGSDIVVELTRRGVEGWEFALVGVQAPTVTGARSVSRFVSGSELVASVRASAASILPYRKASQSSAVLLAQALGSVAMATSVGGIPEQIEDGVSGVLLHPGASRDAWRTALEELDLNAQQAMAAAGRRKVEADHDAFRTWVMSLVG